mmetsp:Transcript_13974/g.30368  ORF Transcript_13974/g.30368 Transcript_13974/m.30368 type:complete len:80 (+) Transcript_13974:124-363(+)
MSPTFSSLVPAPLPKSPTSPTKVTDVYLLNIISKLQYYAATNNCSQCCNFYKTDCILKVDKPNNGGNSSAKAGPDSVRR